MNLDSSTDVRLNESQSIRRLRSRIHVTHESLIRTMGLSNCEAWLVEYTSKKGTYDVPASCTARS